MVEYKLISEGVAHFEQALNAWAAEGFLVTHFVQWDDVVGVGYAALMIKETRPSMKGAQP